ncbi:hypothetical protein AtubIFM55763_002996 [Aspergillus tubingensis]|uniref:Uncharacterized protein n=2 Tax=Aspergillus subgen. Circumdati TaxID=2720871 RepID=A0ACD1IIF2_9EURO|nr:hypothetical protein BO79DRAFT_286622 [Aspergillus costaricaensis CBS 115574]GAQ42454.1 similar to An11g06690 [Aspergillus niger]GLA57837.1 hypothetical protein AtubIFM54640_005632 [Aspergillus tubingensis]RAK90167.1 hypothetical protein BO79DRAFT_286622 [Aspergillus costaricaensis CBS 115574]GLA72457.1 hypothetical protein AtubIFM55763_002996 [Aspergillus tubingensis]GLA91775.1 hypothetical protein AtubIFM57143_005287 [Aspergillus tubingensis]
MLNRITPIGRLVQRTTQIQTRTRTLQPATRTFRTIAPLRTTHQQKNETKSGDRNVLDPQRSESSYTGTDSEVAGHDAAFDPSNTSPEGQVEQAQKESEQQGKVSNPLDMSPGNSEVSHARPPQEGGPDHNAEKEGPSSRGWTKKNREVRGGNRKY